MNLYFWLLLNLAVPVVGPVFTLALVAPAYGGRVAGRLIAASVKDGQLFWCAIGLCAAGIYEAVTALERGSGEVSLLALAIVAFCGLAFICSSILTSSVLKARHDGLDAARDGRQTELSVRTFTRVAIVISILATCGGAAAFAALHIHLN
ncbi:hypothetical protein LJ656_02035 [Paraburkholderia sp. MMS20-SJTR3]|uniref:DUF4149 domain-containing protein n=1 Tax=Paraburkholderia sejongensis TaxID=2886946 RepID=A0ABS8JN77_9BURK|nr:hypothetical protein [Paraburkholderia sp. MMS20-SJTR3]MCC8391354.1 hypothetical protein [Paraburkholderia sp. MMS20-SJTR3]